MLTLRTSKASPFGRKIRIALMVLGLDKEVQIQNADTSDPKDSLRVQNPLGKIPILILDDGSSVFDSPVIVEYLNARHGGNVLIPEGPDRVRVLQQQALADGILDAAILIMYESRFRDPSIHSQKWLDHQRGKVDRSLAYASQVYADTPAGVANAGSISLAVALGYLDFRFEGVWRKAHPKLAAWLDAFAQANPEYAATAPA